MTPRHIIARRRKCAFTTRSEILRAARARFLAESYENVGLRDIAGDVGVDVALVSRYFGSKDALFREVMRGESDGPKFRPDVSAAELPAYLVSLIASKDDCSQREHVEKLLIALRSASSPAASEIVRDAVRGDVLEPLIQILDAPDAAERACLAVAILFGTTVMRSIMTMEPLCIADDPALRGRLTRLFEAALSPA